MEEEEEKPDPRVYKPDLFEAAERDDTERVLQLLSEGVPPTYVDTFNGWTALHWSAKNGNAVVTRRLLECGAADAYHRAIEKISHAAMEKSATTSSSKRAANEDAEADEEGKAADGASGEASSSAGDDGINATGQGGDGETGTAAAGTNGPTENLMERDDEEDDEFIAEERKLEATIAFHQNTPLLWAAYQGHLLCVWELLQAGYSPNDVDAFGNTAVHLAASNNHYKVLKVLLDDGGRATAVNMYRNTPMDLSTDKRVRELLATAMVAGASMTDDDIKLKHEKNMKMYSNILHSFNNVIAEATSSGQGHSPRGGGGSAPSPEYMRKLSDKIAEAKDWGLDTALIQQAESLLAKLEATQDILQETEQVRNLGPIISQNTYVSAIHRLERTINAAVAAGVERNFVQPSRDLISRAQTEYWAYTMMQRLKDVECAKDVHEHDMKRLTQAIQKAQAFGCDEKITSTALALLKRLEAELNMSRALANIPVVKLPLNLKEGEVLPPDYWGPNDTGKIEETEDYPWPAENGEYPWIPSVAFTSLQKAIEGLKTCSSGADALGANPAVIDEVKVKLSKAEKDLKVLMVKNDADKAAAIEVAAKLAKKMKKRPVKKPVEAPPAEQPAEEAPAA